MQASKKIAVTGATGRVGRHIVDLVQAAGHTPVAISRSTGVDVITGEGLDAALAGAETIIDAATDPSGEEEAATTFFTTAAHNLHEAGVRAGVQRIVVVSIIGTDKFDSGYNAAKFAHEQAHLAGPLPVTILRAAQFHEFVAQFMEWGTQGDIAYVPRMRTQLVAARSVAEALVPLATDPPAADGTILEIAGPREEQLVEIAGIVAAKRGDGLRVQAVEAPDPLFAAGALLPGPGATLAGPTFAEWLAAA